MSLRTFHLLFILIVIAGADLVGGWAIWQGQERGQLALAALGVATIVGAFGLIVYVFKLVRSLDRMQPR
jgi:hypothetical protein